MLKYFSIPMAVALGVGSYPNHQHTDFAVLATGQEPPAGLESPYYAVSTELRQVRVFTRRAVEGTPKHAPPRPSRNAFPMQGELAAMDVKLHTADLPSVWGAGPDAEPVLCLTPSQWQQHGKHYQVDITVREISGEGAHRPKRAGKPAGRAKKARQFQDNSHVRKRHGSSQSWPKRVPQGLPGYPHGLRAK